MKYERDGMVAVLYSPGFGAGWASWNCEHAEILAFHPLLVEPVDQYEQEIISKHQMIEKVLFGLTMLGLEDVYTGGVPDLKICWLKPGSLFRIDEYDGSEHVARREDQEWMVA